MPKFRKKPVIIEAFQMTRERRWDNSEWPEWLNQAWQKDQCDLGAMFPNDLSLAADGSDDRFAIRTPRGVVQVNWGDHIIFSYRHGVYPCRPDAFEEIYEAVPDQAEIKPEEAIKHGRHTLGGISVW